MDQAMQPYANYNAAKKSSKLTIDIVINKDARGLGFSIIRGNDGNFYVKNLIREPAISDGRIRIGDEVVEANGRELSSLTHEQAVEYLRSNPKRVSLKLRRDILIDDGNTEPLQSNKSEKNEDAFNKCSYFSNKNQPKCQTTTITGTTTGILDDELFSNELSNSFESKDDDSFQSSKNSSRIRSQLRVEALNFVLQKANMRKSGVKDESTPYRKRLNRSHNDVTGQHVDLNRTA